jgi:hypothetical protein
MTGGVYNLQLADMNIYMHHSSINDNSGQELANDQCSHSSIIDTNGQQIYK